MLGTASIAQAATPDYFSGGVFTVAESQVVAGQVVGFTRVCGDDIGGNSPAATTIYFDGTQVANTALDADGQASGTFTVPAGTANGTYDVKSTCDFAADGASKTAVSGTALGADPITVQIEVVSEVSNNTTASTTGGTTTTSTSALARTGQDLAPLVSIGAAALVLGGAAVLGARRKQRQS